MMPTTEPLFAGKGPHHLANCQEDPVEMEENGPTECDEPEENQIKTDDVTKENLERASKAVKYNFFKGVPGKRDGKGTATFPDLQITAETEDNPDALIWDAASDYLKNDSKYDYVVVTEQFGSGTAVGKITLEQESAEQPKFFSRVGDTPQFQAKVTASGTRKMKRLQAQQKYTEGGKKGLEESHGHVYVLGTLLTAQFLGVRFKMDSKKETTDENSKKRRKINKSD